MNNKGKQVKLLLGSFVLGVLLATIGIGYFAFVSIEDIKESNKPIQYSEAVQFMIDNPTYAEKVKTNYDKHLKAAEDAFDKALLPTDEDLGKE